MQSFTTNLAAGSLATVLVLFTSCSSNEKEVDNTVTYDNKTSECVEKTEENVSEEIEIQDQKKLECKKMKEEVSNADYIKLLDESEDYIDECGDYGISSVIKKRASELIEVENKAAAKEVKELADPLLKIDIDQIKTTQLKIVKIGQIVVKLKNIGGAGRFSSRPDIRICEKARDFLHFRLRDPEDSEIPVLFSKSKEIINSNKVCKSLLEEINVWESFYNKCILNKNCLEYSDISVEFSKKETGNVIDNIKKWWNDEAVKIKIEHVNNEGTADILEEIVLNNGRKWEANSLPVHNKDNVKVSILRETDKSENILGSVAVPVSSFLCKHNTEVGKVKTLKRSIKGCTDVEVKIKVNNIKELECPWNI